MYFHGMKNTVPPANTKPENTKPDTPKPDTPGLSIVRSSVVRPSIVRETLTQQICGFLKAQILSGETVAGDRLWADELAESIGVSVAPVKEALLILAGEGLIRNIPRRGSVIRSFSFTEVQELYGVRRLLEVEALDIMFASDRVTDNFVDRLADINSKIGAQVINGEFADRQIAFELDWEFHQYFMQNSQQSLLVELYSRLNTQAQIIRYSSWNLGPRGDQTFEEHNAIIAALRNRQLAPAKQAVTAHLASILKGFEHYGQANGTNEASVAGGKTKNQTEPLPSGRKKSKTRLG